MRCDKESLLLYAVTDRSWTKNDTLYHQVEEALKGGVTFLQLREKDLNTENFLQEAEEMKKLCAAYRVPFVINDNVEIARTVGADGVHVGQDDMPAWKVREILGEDKIIGVSAQTVEQAIKAEKMEQITWEWEQYFRPAPKQMQWKWNTPHFVTFVWQCRFRS